MFLWKQCPHVFVGFFFGNLFIYVYIPSLSPRARCSVIAISHLPFIGSFIFLLLPTKLFPSPLITSYPYLMLDLLSFSYISLAIFHHPFSIISPLLLPLPIFIFPFAHHWSSLFPCLKPSSSLHPVSSVVDTNLHLSVSYYHPLPPTLLSILNFFIPYAQLTSSLPHYSLFFCWCISFSHSFPPSKPVNNLNPILPNQTYISVNK